MKVKFVGAAGRVSGSCTWLRYEEHGLEFLIDCGLVQGEGDGGEWNAGSFPFDPAKIKFVVLTHAHLDHCGLIPMLYKCGFTGTVYATTETSELAKINLLDAARLGGVPYGKKDVEQMRFHEPVGKGLFGSYHPVGPDLFLHFLRSSHLMGAVSVEVLWGPPPSPGAESIQKRILFSGDLGMNREGAETQPLLRSSMQQVADYAVVESTYGGKVRGAEETDYEARLACLADAIQKTVIERRGTLLIPAFAIGRFQDVMLDLYLLAARDPGRFGTQPILTAAPMADRASSVYLKGLMRTAANGGKVVKPLWRSHLIQELLGLDAKSVEDEDILANLLAEAWQRPEGFVRDPRRDGHSSAIVRNWARRHEAWRPKEADPLPNLAGRIIVASDGMCQGGHIVKLLPDLLPRATTTVFFTGYQAGGTNGALLHVLPGIAPDERRRLSQSLRWKGCSGETHTFRLAEVEAEIRVGVGYSGHADQTGLLDWLFYEFKGQHVMAGRTVFLTHGNNGARRDLEAAIEKRAAELGYGTPPTVLLPSPNDGWYDLDHARWLGDDEGDEIVRLEARLSELRRRRETCSAGISGS